MKYILLKRRNSNYKKEINSRIVYLYDVFKLWYMKVDETSEYIVLQSFPYTILNDMLFLIGHCDAVKDYIINNKILEKNIVIVSCYDDSLKMAIKKLKNKNILYSFLDNQNMTEMYDGKDYNFKFAEISKSEVLLYNYRNESLETKMEKSFKKWSEKYE
jgi:hypothetical protein